MPLDPERSSVTTGTRGRRIFVGMAQYAAITLCTLLVVDGVFIAFGLFPPAHHYGDPDLGWRSAAPSDRMNTGVCTQYSTGQTFRFPRNEDGIRTDLSRRKLLEDSTGLKIAATGDSQTDLCATNDSIHSGILESELASEGIRTRVLTFGSGRYSPLQDYLAFRTILRPYGPSVLILNIYTGNDFYDILRVDDRPHFVRADTGYRIEDPVWYSLDDPEITYRSRVMYALRAVGERTGVRGIYFRVSELRRLGAEYGGGPLDVWKYMRDLWRAREPSVGYSDAFAAQILNQQLFFHYFPRAEDESIRRVKALMALVRAENPGLLLVMSPLPSYQLAGQQPVDEPLMRTLERLPVSYQEGVSQEAALYDSLRRLAWEEGWIFVDNLAPLQAYRGTDRLYNDFDYHLLPAASALIGRAQAAALLDTLRRIPL